MNWWLDPEKVKKRNETMKRNMQKKYGVDNPRQIPGITEKIRDTCEEKYGGVGYSSSELKKKSDIVTKKRYGRSNIMKTEEGKKHFRGDNNPLRQEKNKLYHSTRVKEYYESNPHHTKGKTYEEIMGEERAEERKKELKKSGAYGQSLNTRISQPQLKLFKLVKQKYPSAILEYPVGDYCIDIAVPEEKLAFEYDGSYWHDIEKDKERDSILEELGWKVIRYVDFLPCIIE